MRRAPQRDVQAEQPVPEVVDRRRQDRQRDPPGRQVKDGRAADAEDAVAAGKLAAGEQAADGVEGITKMRSAPASSRPETRRRSVSSARTPKAPRTMSVTPA